MIPTVDNLLNVVKQVIYDWKLKSIEYISLGLSKYKKYSQSNIAYDSQHVYRPAR